MIFVLSRDVFKRLSVIPIWLLILGLCACGGGGTSSQDNSVSEDTFKLVLSSSEAVEGVQIKKVSTLPYLPEGQLLDGDIYEVTVPDNAPLPAKISIAASDELIAAAGERRIVIGRFNGTDWDLIPAALIDGKVTAEIDHFSQVGIFSRFLVLDIPTDAAQLTNLMVEQPNLNWLEVQGDEIFANFDLSHSVMAFDRNNANDFIRDYYPVKKLQMNVSLPIITLGKPSNRDTAFQVFQINGENFINLEQFTTEELSRFRVKIPVSDYVNYDLLINLVTSGVKANYGYWNIKFVPVFDETVASLPKLGVAAPVGVAEAYTRLRMGLAGRLEASLATEFLARTAQESFLLPYQKGWAEVYSNPITWNKAANMALWGVSRPLIGIQESTDWERVVSHEWGHYASHMLMGDDWTAAAPGGNHVGWLESSSRHLAWSEELATFFSQWATNPELTKMDDSSGSMNGYMSENDASRFSQYPEPGKSTDMSTYWPNDTDMDAIKVEAVSSTILSSLAQEYGFDLVSELVITGQTKTLTEFILQWIDYFGETSEQVRFLQGVCLLEGVSWKVMGRVLNNASVTETGLEGVSVTLKSSAGGYALETTTTDAAGYFNITLPPGEFSVVLEKSGLDSIDAKSLTADYALETNGEWILTRDGVYYGAAPADWRNIAFRMEPAAFDDALSFNLRFYAGGSTVPTSSDYQYLHNEDNIYPYPYVNQSCAEIVNESDSYSSHCVYVESFEPGNEAGNEVEIQLRLSKILTPGTYTLDGGEKRGEWARISVCTDDLASINCASTSGMTGTITINEFGVTEQAIIQGSIDADLRGGSSDFGYLYGHISGDFLMKVPIDI